MGRHEIDNVTYCSEIYSVRRSKVRKLSNPRSFPKFKPRFAADAEQRLGRPLCRRHVLAPQPEAPMRVLPGTAAGGGHCLRRPYGVEALCTAQTRGSVHRVPLQASGSGEVQLHFDLCYPSASVLVALCLERK